MSLIRFSVSLDKALVAAFDRGIRAEQCPTRSKAVGDLIRQKLVADDWLRGRDVAGAVVIVYDHHNPQLLRKLVAIQHDHHHSIISTQHVHLDHDNCLEIIAVKGDTDCINRLIRSLKALKGLKHVACACATTGKNLA